MGLGKTATTLWALHDSKAKVAVIVCPVSVKWNWQRELRETIGENWHVFVVDGTAARRADTFVDIKSVFSRDVNVAVILNYDLLRSITEDQYSLLVKHVSFLILDESHYIKNASSERSTLAKLIAENSEYVALLSGTPITNYSNDLFSQVDSIQPGTWTSYNDFCHRYVVFRQIERGRVKRMIPVASKNERELNVVVNTLQIKRRKVEVVNLPPKIYTYPELSFDSTMISIYRAMRDFARYEIKQLIESEQDGGQQLIWNPRVRTGATHALMRCEQIAQGFIGGIPEPVMEKVAPHLKRAEKIEGRPQELIFPHSAKIVWLSETIDAILRQGGRPVIFSRFNGPIFWMHKKYPDSGILHGGLKPQEKDDAIQRFQGNETKILFVQVKMAVGFNLTSSQDVLFFGRDWSPATNAQAEDRCHRIGQTGTVNIQIPLVRGTVDQYLDTKLRAKASSAESALATVSLGELLEAL